MGGVEISGLSILSPVTRCAHICRYCSIGATKFTRLPFPRLAATVERFAAWRRERGLHDFSMWFFAGNAFDYPPEMMGEVRRLWLLTGQPADGIATGGLRRRDDVKLRTWLTALKGIGITRLHFAFAVHRAVHDRWNGRRGDFEWLMNIQKIGTELDLSLSQSLFLAKSTLPLLDELMEELDEAGGRIAWRWAFPFGYLGHARRHEDERIDERDRDTLTPRVAAACGPQKEWLSEREWIERLDGRDDPRRHVNLTLRLDEHNIDAIDAASCDDIIAKLSTEAATAEADVPSLGELCKRVGDPTNRRIYAGRDDIERLWRDRFQRRQTAV